MCGLPLVGHERPNDRRRSEPGQVFLLLLRANELPWHTLSFSHGAGVYEQTHVP